MLPLAETPSGLTVDKAVEFLESEGFDVVLPRNPTPFETNGFHRHTDGRVARVYAGVVTEYGSDGGHRTTYQQSDSESEGWTRLD